MRRLSYICGGTIQILAIVAFMVMGPSVKSFAALVNPNDADSTTLELGSVDHISKRIDPLFNPIYISPADATGELQHFTLFQLHSESNIRVDSTGLYSSIIRGPPSTDA